VEERKHLRAAGSTRA